MRQLRITNQVTNRDARSLDKYLYEIGKVKLLEPGEEALLAKRIKKGDRAALETLVKANLRFVISVSKQYQNQGLSLSDLISEGNLGLIKAAERFDETRGFKFISYAVWWIRQSILQALAERARIVRLPLNKIGSINKINKAFTKLEQEFQREPTIDELAESLESTPDLVEGAMGAFNGSVSMDAPLAEGSSNSLYDVMLNDESINPEEKLIDTSLCYEIERSLAKLADRQAEILCLYFGLKKYQPHTLEEIGKKLGLTRERVRQIKEKSIEKLKNQCQNEMLRSYLGK